MVNDFSNFAKPLNVQKSPLAFSALLKEVFDLYRGHYERIYFTLEILAKSDHIDGNSQMLRQVLHNLIKNAIEACELRIDKHGDISTGTIDITLQAQEKHLILKIADNGIGLAENGSQLFDPYVTTKEKGTGLGLAIVKKIIQEHQGRIELRARDDERGVVAVVSLPLIQPKTDKT